LKKRTGLGIKEKEWNSDWREGWERFERRTEKIIRKKVGG
jgi:hypothetical protein